MLNHGYLAQTLRRPLPTKDGGTLHTGPARPIILSHYRNIGVGAIGTALVKQDEFELAADLGWVRHIQEESKTVRSQWLRRRCSGNATI